MRWQPSQSDVSSVLPMTVFIGAFVIAHQYRERLGVSSRTLRARIQCEAHALASRETQTRAELPSGGDGIGGAMRGGCASRAQQRTPFTTKPREAYADGPVSRDPLANRTTLKYWLRFYTAAAT